MKKQICIVEDDENVAESLQELLYKNYYHVILTQNISETLIALRNHSIDLLLLDVHLKEESGYELCKKIRKLSDIPILFLTGCNTESELLEGFQSGGDDYLTKPFRMRELLARIEALLRRTTSKSCSCIKSGELTFNCDTQLMLFNHDFLDLTSTERKLVWLLMENYPRTLPREELLYQVWDKRNFFVESNTLTVNMCRLRDKLGSFEGTPYIETIRGIGYRWAIPVRR